MDATILQQAEQKRKLKALAMVEAGAVTPNGSPHQYYILSQAGDGRYLAATPEAFPPRGLCTCPDSWAKSHGIRCKHIIAACIWEAAETYGQNLIDKHGRSAVESKILSDLNNGLPPLTATRMTILWHAVMRITAKMDDEAADDLQDAVDMEIERRKDNYAAATW
jgi:hypothetical protein